MHMLAKSFLDVYSESSEVNLSIIRAFEHTEVRLNRVLNENKYSFDINLSGVAATCIGKITSGFGHGCAHR